MRVHHRADRRPRTVQHEVRREVRRRAQLALDDTALEIGHHEVARLHLLVRHATRLDHDEPARAVNRARVAESEEREAATEKLAIRREHFIAQRGHGARATRRPRRPRPPPRPPAPPPPPPPPPPRPAPPPPPGALFAVPPPAGAAGGGAGC